MSFEEGPFVQAACFCDTVLQETAGVFSLIRVVDTVEQSATGPNPPHEMPAFTIRLKMVIMLKSGSALGRRDLKIVPQLPTKETKDPLIYSVHFEGEEKGHNFLIDFGFTLEHEGVYWFKIYIADENEENILTSIPLRAKYNRQITK